MNEQYLLISGWMISIKRAMDICVLDFNVACKKLAIDTSAFANPESRIAVDNVTKMLEFCNQKLNRNDFSLLVAEQFHPNIFHALGYAMISSENLQSALECIAHYKKVVSNTCKLTVLEENDHLIFRMHIFKDKNTNKAVLSYVGVELFIATMVKFSRELAGSNTNPVKVFFSYPKPSYNIDFLTDYFQCSIEFNAKNTAILFDLTQAKNRVITNNPLITQMHKKMLDDFMSRINKDDLASVVKSKVFELLPSGTCSQQIIAKNLGYSLRSFQRKLKDQGTSYKNILEQTRKELALDYIKQRHLTYTEISYLVGFSCVANFNRAFKQWTNTTPSKYRQSIS